MAHRGRQAEVGHLQQARDRWRWLSLVALGPLRPHLSLIAHEHSPRWASVRSGLGPRATPLRHQGPLGSATQRESSNLTSLSTFFVFTPGRFTLIPPLLLSSLRSHGTGGGGGGGGGRRAG